MTKKNKSLSSNDYSQEKYFPLGSKNEIRCRFVYGTDLYIMTRCGYTYKVFIVNEDYPDGKKYGESDCGSELLNKIPHYWG